MTPRPMKLTALMAGESPMSVQRVGRDAGRGSNSLPPMDPTARFVELVSGPETALPLDEAWYLVSAHARPELALDDVRSRLDELAAGVTSPTLDAVVGVLFEKEGFGGNTADYYDPDNSFLDQVLERHRGIPLSLSMLTIEV